MEIKSPATVAGSLRRERMVNGMFDDDKPFSTDGFGLISADKFWERIDE